MNALSASRNGAWLLAACLLLGAGGCATYSHGIRQVEQLAAADRPAQALQALEKLELDGDDRLLHFLNRGLLLRQTGDYRGSIAAFEQAKRIMAELEAVSVSETASSLTVTESWSAYAGFPYERVMLHVLQALNHLALDDLEAARVEALQIDLYLRRMHGETRSLPYGGDSFARYLSGLIFEAGNEPDAALVAYRQALRSYEANGLAVPADLQERLLRLTRALGLNAEHAALRERFGREAPPLPPASGEVVAIVASGMVPRRIAVESLGQDPASGRMYRISLPSLLPRPTRLRGLTLAAGERQSRGEPAENLNQAARRSLEARLPVLTLRAISRLVVKEAAADSMEREHGAAAGALVNFLGVLLEQADTRDWSLLPGRIYLAALALPAGRHDLELTLYDGAGRVLETRRYRDVPVEPDGIHFVMLRRFD